MTLPSIHRIRNSSPGDLSPLGHRGSHKIESLRVSGTDIVSLELEGQSGARTRDLRLSNQASSLNHCTRDQPLISRLVIRLYNCPLVNGHVHTCSISTQRRAINPAVISANWTYRTHCHYPFTPDSSEACEGEVSCPRTQHTNNVLILRGKKHDITLKILHRAGLETARQAATLEKRHALTIASRPSLVITECFITGSTNYPILDNHVKNKKYGNFVSISSLTGECAAEKFKNFCSSSLLTCLHHMVILRSQNKNTDFLMILAWNYQETSAGDALSYDSYIAARFL